MSVSAGWYPDPADPTTQRYWDGDQWVGGPVPVGTEPPAVPPPAIAPPAVIISKPADQPADPAPVTAPPHAAGAPTDALGDTGLSALLAGPSPAAPILRLLARLIDIATVCTLALIVNSYFLYQYLQEMAPQTEALRRQLEGGPRAPAMVVSPEAQRLGIVILLTSIALWFAYEVPATANTGQTLGKRLVGLRVEKLDGTPLSLWQSTRRWLVMSIPSSLPGCLGLPIQLLDCAWCTWDKPLRQTLHDKAVMTMVVVGGPRPPETTTNE